MSQQQIKSNKRQPRRLPFHPRRSSRKPRLELAADATALSDVLELTTSPILDRAVQAGLTPPPTASPGSTGVAFRWPKQPEQPEQKEEQQADQQQKQRAKQQQKRQAEQQKRQAEPQAKRQEQQPAQQQKPTTTTNCTAHGAAAVATNGAAHGATASAAQGRKTEGPSPSGSAADSDDDRHLGR
ncbi:hypothetical protein ACLKA6_010177 [Drosophila palustris]